MENKLMDKLEMYEKYYSTLKQELKWQVVDARVLMLISSMYVVRKKELDVERFKEIAEYVKKKKGVFSALNSAQVYVGAATLDIRFDNPEEKYHEWMEVYDQLVDSSFQRGSFTYISALLVLDLKKEADSREDLIKGAKRVFDLMKKDHMFLTSSSDYPIAVLLAASPLEEAPLMAKIEELYGNLNDKGFKKSNELQMLSHILALRDNEDTDILVKHAMDVVVTLEAQEKKVRPIHYPEVGIMALAEEKEMLADFIVRIENALNEAKDFKWHKKMNFTIAVQLSVSEYAEEASIMETAVQTSLESILQAQQAAMTGAMAGAIASGSGSGSGGN
ncbi:DUF4003 family protein [Sinobaca sp. H24]|uniref:DUF4003 family protein n=1 Tax=Sinobaca sp. H24 TaxID=2923376 RepID=UPI002079B923|nr:DUF4003 family protein [Sinobaca sp. H24]